MKRIWEELPALSNAVRKSHEEIGFVGHHDFVHAARVGEIARQIAINEWSDNFYISLLAGAAGLCHNADRIVQKLSGVGRHEVSPSAVENITLGWLAETEINYEMKQRIVDAVLKHDGHNCPSDSRVLIALMDADRIVNLDNDVFLRAGQFYPDLPTVDYKHFLDSPTAKYNNPCSILKNVHYCLDWVTPGSPVCVRTRLGEKLAEERVSGFKTFFTTLARQLAQEGIRPYPFG